MIICFSGTGNSRMVADIIQDTIGDELVRFPPGLLCNPGKISLKVNDDRVIWVLPIYGWGMPRGVRDVLEKAVVYSRHDLKHHLVCTCGDDIGYADLQWRKLLRRRGWQPCCAFSVQMPNTYTFMKGFDVDAPEVARAKLDAAPARVEAIARTIDAGRCDVVDVVRGSWPWLKTRIVSPWFSHFKTKTAPFHATDACVGCGKCSLNCPMMMIRMVNGRPEWRKGHCTMCSRCYNCCPQHAVAYSRETLNKGQYICPGYTLLPGNNNANPTKR